MEPSNEEIVRKGEFGRVLELVFGNSVSVVLFNVVASELDTPDLFSTIKDCEVLSRESRLVECKKL